MLQHHKSKPGEDRFSKKTWFEAKKYSSPIANVATTAMTNDDPKRPEFTEM
jgi:hypothetical protein